jgi:hypothetical protein
VIHGPGGQEGFADNTTFSILRIDIRAQLLQCCADKDGWPDYRRWQVRAAAADAFV